MAKSPPFDFYEWNKEEIEKGLEVMGCKNPSVGALPLRKLCMQFSDASAILLSDPLQSIKRLCYIAMRNLLNPRAKNA